MSAFHHVCFKTSDLGTTKAIRVVENDERRDDDICTPINAEHDYEQLTTPGQTNDPDSYMHSATPYETPESRFSELETRRSPSSPYETPQSFN